MSFRRLGVVAVALSLAASSVVTARAAAPRPWTDRSRTPEQRAAALLARMTLDEKIAMVHGIPELSQPGDFYVGYIPANDRLGIPAVTLEDGPAGVGDFMPGVTNFPAPLAAAATWDPSIVQRFGEALGREQAGKGVTFALAPTVNILRNPQWGRSFEGFSEDPNLTAAMAVAEIRGIQSQGVIATVKHFAAYNQEINRMTGTADVSERALHEIYLPAFRAAVEKAQVGAVMTSYNKVNRTYVSQNAPLLTTLKQAWGFPGVVMSDWGGTYSTVPAALAGLDLEMPSGTYFGDALKQAVLDGRVPMATLDDKVRRLLTQLFRFGFFDGQRGNPAAVVSTPDNVRVARSVAEAGTVLLKNDGAVLPLRAASTRSIAVIGQAAVVPKTQGCGSAWVNQPVAVSPLQGITARAGNGVRVRYVPGDDIARARAVAAAADVAIVVANDEGCEDIPWSQAEGSSTNDKTSLALPGNQDALVDAVSRVNPRTVVVLDTQGAVLMPWVRQVPAILEAWYPGQEDGNALASVLFGDTNPAGRLPVTFPRRAADLPAHTPAQYPGIAGRASYSEDILVGYRHYDAAGIEPLFAFGHGLSYTSFAYRNLAISRAPGGDGDVVVTAEVRNTGTRPGAEVAQLYLGAPASTGEPPRQLKAFQKVLLKPGQAAQVRFRLSRADLAFFDPGRRAWSVAPGRYSVMVGASSRDIRLVGGFTR